MFNYYASKWKREPINDHKFDFINIHDFRDNRLSTQFSYCLVVLLSLKSLFVYMADIWTTLVLLHAVNTPIVFLPKAEELKWVFLGSILCSFLILLWDIRKSFTIYRSRDIAFAFTDIICYNLFSLKSYSYFCLFHRIENSKNARDTLVFFVFFRLKRWKRTMLAEAPRQIINGYTLYSQFIKFNSGTLIFDTSVFYGSVIQSTSLILIIISFTIFVFSAIAIVFAILLYIPLICQIQGNLKEYICHKIDKRIGHILKNKAKRRLMEHQQRVLQREYSVTRQINSNPEFDFFHAMPSPTLPNIAIDDDELRDFSRLTAKSLPESLKQSQSSISVKYSQPAYKNIRGRINQHTFTDEAQLTSNIEAHKHNSHNASLSSSYSTTTTTSTINKASHLFPQVPGFITSQVPFQSIPIHRKPIKLASDPQPLYYYRPRPPVSPVSPAKHSRTSSPSSVCTTTPLISSPTPQTTGSNKNHNTLHF